MKVDANGNLPPPFDGFEKAYTFTQASANHLSKYNATICGVKIYSKSGYWGEPGDEVSICQRCFRAITKTLVNE